jgi:hypothetical protein
MAAVRTDNFCPPSQHRDEMEVHLPHNSFDSIPLSEFPQPKTNYQQSGIRFPSSELPEMPFPFISQINHQITHELQQPPNYEDQLLDYTTLLGTVQESIQQERPFGTPGNFDMFPNSYQFEQFNSLDQTANLNREYQYIDSTVWNKSTSEHLAASNNDARTFGENYLVELNPTDATPSLPFNFTPDTVNLQLPVQILEASPSLEDNFSSNASTFHMPSWQEIPQSNVTANDTEFLNWNWQGVQTRKSGLFSLPLEHASGRSNATTEVRPPEFQFRSSSYSRMDMQERLVTPPTPETFSSINTFGSLHRPLIPRFVPIHFTNLSRRTLQKSKRGNNDYGRAGTKKCDQCRNQHKKVILLNCSW